MLGLCIITTFLVSRTFSTRGDGGLFRLLNTLTTDCTGSLHTQKTDLSVCLSGDLVLLLKVFYKDQPDWFSVIR